MGPLSSALYALRQEIEGWCRGRFWVPRALLLLWFVFIGVRHLADPLYTSLFGALNLGIHEGGHLLFGFAGQFICVAGGTLLQLAAPLASGIMFIRQRDYFALSVCSVWLSTNLYNIATYVGDAREQVLRLVTVGGGREVCHDWYCLLSAMHILSWDTTLAALIRILSFVLMWGSIGAGAWMCWLMARSSRKTP